MLHPVFDLLIPKVNNRNSQLIQSACTLDIIPFLLFCFVNATVHFYDQFSLMVIEIGNKL